MMISVNAGFFILAQLTFTWQAGADLPVHCVRHQVVGDWIFKLGPLSDKRSVCGHERPDAETRQPTRKIIDSQSGDTELALTLSNPNQVLAHGTKKGTWTMVYDEGFEVNVDGHSYFAFSNFTYEKNAARPQEKPHNVSHCGQTMVGWYRNAERTKFGCYYGSMVEKPQQHKKDTAPVTANRLKKQSFDTPLDHKTQKKAVTKLNRRLSMLQLSWRAREVTKWNGRSMRQINDYMGPRRTVSRRDLHKEMMRQQTSRHPHARSFLQRISELSKSWDWSNVSGRNYLEPVMDQADCGSCYAASSVRMLTARHKIKTNNTKAVPWSISFPLHCSEYNQGCNGGYGFLLAKWSDDVGLLPATCMPYNPTDSADACKLQCDLKKIGKRYRAANHRYIGSFYGRANEQMIMEELVRHGPLAIGIEPDADFMYYADGVYRSSVPKNHSKTDDWEQVDHGVLLVGYGEEDGQKYWKVQNSWGPDWGEDGFFRILRGEDESAIESMGEVAEVVEDEQNGRRVSELFEQLGSSAAQSGTKAASVKQHSS